MRLVWPHFPQRIRAVTLSSDIGNIRKAANQRESTLLPYPAPQSRELPIRRRVPHQLVQTEGNGQRHRDLFGIQRQDEQTPNQRQTAPAKRATRVAKAHVQRERAPEEDVGQNVVDGARIEVRGGEGGVDANQQQGYQRAPARSRKLPYHHGQQREIHRKQDQHSDPEGQRVKSPQVVNRQVEQASGRAVVARPERQVSLQQDGPRVDPVPVNVYQIVGVEPGSQPAANHEDEPGKQSQSRGEGQYSAQLIRAHDRYRTSKASTSTNRSDDFGFLSGSTVMTARWRPRPRSRKTVLLCHCVIAE
jgi:hypothetical protein